MFLKQSTSKTIKFGPFLDENDGRTAETALTITQADMQISKGGGNFAQKSDAGNASHDADGWYGTNLSATDTATVGELILQVDVAGAGPVWQRWYVLEEAIYDALLGGGASGFDASAAVKLQATTHTGATIPTVTTVGSVSGAVGSVTGNVGGIAGTIQTLDALDTAQDTQHSTTQAAIADVPTAGENADAIWTEAIADHSGTAGSTAEALAAAGSAGDPWTTTLPGSYTGSQAGNILADVLADTNELQTDDIPGAIAALNDLDSAAAEAAAAAAIAAVNLDHIAGTATGIPAIPAGTYLDQIMDDGTAVYDRTTDSLQAIADNAGGGGLDAAGVRAAVGLASANLDIQLGDIPTVSEFNARTLASADYFDPATDTVAAVTAVGSVSGAVGSVTGSVGSVTAPVTAGTVSDKTGYSLSSAGIQAIWDALTSALTTASSIGKLLVDNINATISSRASQTSVDDVPTNTEFNARTLATADYATAANQTTLLNRFGAFTGTGVNTVLGFFQALMRSDATTPSDVGGTYDDATDSLQAIADNTGGSAPTAGEIADAVWTEAIADHSGTVGSTAEALASAATGGDPWATTLPASYTGSQAGKILADVLVDTGTTLPAAIAALDVGGGSGARSVVITVNDGTDPLENVDVRLAEGVNTFVRPTDASGQATFNLDDATYNVYLSKAGYDFDNDPQVTIVVDGNETATYSMSAIAYSAPANPAQTTVAVTVVSGTGAAVTGRVVEFLLQSPPAGLGLVYVDTRVTATVPANGVTTAALYKGATYKMMVVGSTPWQDLTIPAAAGDSYTDVPPLVV